VLVSAPCDGADKTIVFGVNDQTLEASDLVVSNGSCTTNCLAPVAKVLLDLCGIERGYMTTVHAFTSDQPTQDTLHSDLYRARSAGLSMIPTSTGAAKALGLVLPQLAGKLDGSSIRVPTANVSVVDLKIVPSRPTSREAINEAMSKAAAEGPLKGVLAVTNDPLVSVDLNHIDASATVALPQTQVIDGQLARVLAWYDNEWGFSTRMADTALAMAKLA
jgi:glyceraldehyde 3-phosphate dehydrogenase